MGNKNDAVQIKKNCLGAIILAGGRSSRIGPDQDKGQMKLMGVPLIDRVYQNLFSSGYFMKENIIIVGPKEKYPYYQRVIEDYYPRKGPLGGIFTGLHSSKTFYNLVVGCDMPFIHKDLIGLMIQCLGFADIVIPGYGYGLLEPLCAIYSKNCLNVIQDHITRDNLAIRNIFPLLNVLIIPEKDIRKKDPDLRSFFNINFKNDFSKATELDQKKGGKIVVTESEFKSEDNPY